MSEEVKKEDWMNAKWRPMMGWMYMLVCTMDFVVFPILWSLAQALSHGNVSTQWQPVTLQGAGLFHMAMGAVIGVSAFGRTQEKLAGASTSIPIGTTPSIVTPPQPPAPVVDTTPPPPAFGSTAPAFGSTSPAAPAPAPVFMSSTGKPMPAPQVDPQI
jgi:hypothetical protein